MGQDNSKINVLVLRKPIPGEDSGPWTRLAKALKAFANVEEREISESPTEQDLDNFTKDGNYVFLDLPLVNTNLLAGKIYPTLTLIKKDSFSWNSPKSREKLLPVFTNHPCLILEDISASDLLRLMHLYLVPRYQPGVSALMEKGASIVGEKVQGMENIGELVDRLIAYLSSLETFDLKGRIDDMRQVTTGILMEAFFRASQVDNQYPTVDFQASAFGKKLCLNFRFPLGRLQMEELPEMVMDGLDIRWHLLWQCTDQFVITHHEQHNEIEIHAMMIKDKKKLGVEFRSFLLRKFEKSPAKDTALNPPSNYVFSTLSEVKVKVRPQNVVQNTQKQTTNRDEIDKTIDTGYLPPEISERLSKAEEESRKFRNMSTQKETAFKEVNKKLTHVNRDLAQKKNEILKLMRSRELQQEAFKKKIAELERATQTAKAHTAAVQKKDPNDIAAQENLKKAEAHAKMLEIENSRIKEKLAQEQKRIEMSEKEQEILFQDITVKDKEIAEHKSAMLKLQMEITAEKNARAAAEKTLSLKSSAPDVATGKKDIESKDAATLKQELKKAQLKIDNHDKNLKAIQTESENRVKMIEQKLQAAKSKELELMKKIEELTATVKKASRAA